MDLVVRPRRHPFTGPPIGSRGVGVYFGLSVGALAVESFEVSNLDLARSSGVRVHHAAPHAHVVVFLF